MPLSPRALTTLATVKSELGITDTASDTLLERYINSSSDAIIKMIERDLVHTVYTGERYQGSGATKLYLKDWPIVSIQKIEVDDVGEYIVGDDYELTDRDKREGTVYNQYMWPKVSKTFGDLTTTVGAEEERSITIDYTAGYCTPNQVTGLVCPLRTLPYDLEDLVIDMVATAYGQYCTHTKGQKSYKAGGRTIEWLNMLNDNQKAIINSYKRYEL